MWQSRLTTLLFKYSGMGKTPAAEEEFIFKKLS
jgi:hypothetical protein